MRWKIYKGGYTADKKLPQKLHLLGVYETNYPEIINFMRIYVTDDAQEDIYAIGRENKIRCYIIAYKRDVLGEING